jgi:hypothetical protein
MKLSKLQKQQKDLLKQLTENKIKQKEINKNEFLATFKCQIGDLVKFTSANGTVAEGILVDLVYEDITPVAPIIAQQKKNGEPGRTRIKCPKGNVSTFEFVNHIL